MTWERDRLFVVVGAFNNEGYDLPIGVYSTRELAEDAKVNNESLYENIKIYEYTLDYVAEEYGD